MSDKERDSAARRKRAADPGQPQKTGAAKPTMVSTDPKKVMPAVSKKQQQFFGIVRAIQKRRTSTYYT